MDKKIGDLVLLVILFFFFQSIQTYNEKITIDVTNRYQTPVQSVEIGIPFLIIVTCEGFRPQSDIKGFELLNSCTIQSYGTTQSSTYINGVVTEKYMFTYVAVASKKGSLELGPVFAEAGNGRVISSEKLMIKVADIQEREHTGKEPYLLDVEVDSKKVYVGQKLTIFLRFCYLTGFENLAIENIAIDDVDFGTQDKEWKNGKISFAGKAYSCKEMAFDVYPKKVGALIIPPCKASFIPERAQDIGLFGLFGFSNSKVIESHPKQIEILPLPLYHKGKVDAIGQFDSVELQIPNKKAQVGEGIVAKMIVHGDGNLAVMHHPEFQAPATIHFYEGNSSVEPNKKIFEWVLQSDRSGAFTIEPQIFTYFDPADEKYKQLLTKSAQLKVEGLSNQSEQEEEIIVVEIESEQKSDELSQEEETIENLEQSVKKPTYYSAEKFYKRTSSQLLQNWIMIILVILLLLITFYIVRPYLMKIFFIQTLGYRISFWKYYYQGDVTAMYQLFEQLAKAYNFGLQSLELQDCFFKMKLSNEAFDNWKNFITMLLEFNFSKEKTIEDKKLALDLAKQWFGVILNCCKEIQKEK
jgi:hypothetical protein